MNNLMTFKTQPSSDTKESEKSTCVTGGQSHPATKRISPFAESQRLARRRNVLQLAS